MRIVAVEIKEREREVEKKRERRSDVVLERER